MLFELEDVLPSDPSEDLCVRAWIGSGLHVVGLGGASRMKDEHGKG